MPNTERVPKLTESQKKVLAALLTADHALTNAELTDATGSKKPSDIMSKLASLGLAQTDKSRRLHAHQLTGSGRHVAGELKVAVDQASVKETLTAREAGLTSSQVLALVVLMAEARDLSNEELQELAGFSLTGRDNAELERQGLVETDRSQRPFSHQLTDKGWRVARELHATRPPQASGSAIRSLFTVLTNVHRALDRFQISHAEFFKQTSGTSSARVPMADSGDVEARIRSAYRDLARVPGDWIGLAELRERLADLERAALDAALLALRHKEDVRIIPVANTKALKPQDHAAALRIGDSDAHALAIGRR